MTDSISRRSFIKAAAVVGAGAGFSVLGFSLAGCSSDDKSPTTDDTAATDNQKTEELFPIRMVSLSIFNEFVVGEELGFFADEGIEIVYTGSTPQGVTEFQLIEQGELDMFCNTHPPSLAQARIAGLDMVSVQPGTRDTSEYPHVQYLVLEDSDIQSIEDFRGKKVGISGLVACTNGFIDYYLGQKLSDYSPDDIEYVTLANTVEPSLLSGQIDVATSHNPAAGVTLAAGGVRRVATSSDILQQEDFSLGVRGFSQKFIDEHPDIVQGFANACYRSRLWIENNREEAIKINAAYLNVDPATVSPAAYELNKNHVRADLERWLTIGEAIGNWEPGQITVDEIYTNEFVPVDPPASDADIRWDGTVDESTGV
ncbi:MAG: ABC transporter substrate-binding protein [Coriobacteriales bacterium]|jgi:ABC-type nitrate/sulfonate/bicarbonate transport system substrate-binding protein|nr:ABC transporter substrate-binding protein [Coriobacteriales bacterium]